MSATEQAIADLVLAVADRTDAGDFAAVGDLFTDADFVIEGATTVHGARAVEALQTAAIRLHLDGTPRTVHLVGNLRITVEHAGTARATSRFVAFQATDDLPLQPIGAGTYEDTFRQDGSTWRFTSRTVRTTLSGNTTQFINAGNGPQQEDQS